MKTATLLLTLSLAACRASGEGDSDAAQPTPDAAANIDAAGPADADTTDADPTAPDADTTDAPIAEGAVINEFAFDTNGTSSDKVCTHGFQNLAGGGVLEFRMTLVGGTLMPLADFHIGGQHANGPGAQPGRIISESAIPEPSAAAAFLVGSLVIGAARRRRH